MQALFRQDSLEELNDLDPKRGKKDERKKGRNYRSAASGQPADNAPSMVQRGSLLVAVR